MIKPIFDYLLCEEVREETGAVTGAEIADHWQKYKVLATGEGRYNETLNIFIDQPVKAGDTIWVQKHAEADTPDDLKAKGQYLIMASRVMAVE